MISSNTAKEGGFQSLPLHVDQDRLRSVFLGFFFCVFLKLPSMNLTASSPLKVRQDTQKETHLPTPGFQVRAVGFRVTVVMTKI